MKRIFIVLAVLAALSLSVSSAGAATSQAKQIKTLQKQVKSLQKSVTTLQAQTTSLNNDLTVAFSLASLNFTVTTCSMAMTADLFQSTWIAINTYGGIGTIFDSGLLAPALYDDNACSDIDLMRGPAGAKPSWTAYNSLIAWLYAPA